MKELFQKLIAENQLAQSYLFFGADADELKNFCRWLAETIEGKSGLLTDSFFIEPIADTISIDQIREMKQLLWQKPLRAARKTVIITRAEQLTPEAQNAVLKIAEEPPAHGLVVLTVNDPQALLPTLVSRLQKIFVAGGASEKTSLSMRKYALDFLGGAFLQRRQILKDVLEQDKDRGDHSLDDLVKTLMVELDRDPVRNWRALKELLYRWSLISQYNVNKRLQLEAFARVADTH